MHYTLKEIIFDGRYAFIFFVVIFALKFIKSTRVPESANFIPFFVGLIHGIFQWVVFYETAEMGHPDRMINYGLEIIAFGSIFTVLLIIVDVIRSFIKPKKTKITEPEH